MLFCFCFFLQFCFIPFIFRKISAHLLCPRKSSVLAVQNDLHTQIILLPVLLHIEAIIHCLLILSCILNPILARFLFILSCLSQHLFAYHIKKYIQGVCFLFLNKLKFCLGMQLGSSGLGEYKTVSLPTHPLLYQHKFFVEPG